MERTLQERATEAGEEIARIAGEKTAPVDPMRIAAAEKDQLTVIGDDFKNAFDGQLEYHKKQSRFLMFYNNKYDRNLPEGEHHARTRFSIGHELGHFYLERHNDYLRRGGRKHRSRGEFTTGNLVEREADSFSAGLLMPRFLMEEPVNEAELSIDRIIALATTFKTSTVSTALRAVALSDFPCAVVGIRRGAVAWVSRSESLIKNGFYPPSRGSFSSPTALAQYGQFSTGMAQRHTAPVYARHWFKTFDRDELEQVSVTEEYLPVPILETLVVLLTIPEDELRLVSDFD
jgi:Zn-dependent peptidase ImmA (M78 family)